MSKPKQKESQEVFQKVQTALFHIHSVADILEDMGMNDGENMSNDVSNPLVSMAQIIKEKTEYCLKSIDEEGVAR